MSMWSEAGALCDLAIEAIDRRKMLRGEARKSSWKTARKILDALDAALNAAMDDEEAARCARLEFAAIENSRSGSRSWPVSGAAWRAGAKLLDAPEAASMALGRASSLARSMAGALKLTSHTPIRKDVGGKLLRIMREGSLAWLEEEKGAHGHVGPTGRALADWALDLHGRWCQRVGVLAEWDWEHGIHDYGFGLWHDEVNAGQGGPFERWGQRLLEASEKALLRFGRLPRIPLSFEHQSPSWIFLENYAAHDGATGVMNRHWAWCSRYPLTGVHPSDERAVVGHLKLSPRMLDDRLRGRSLAIGFHLESAGLGRLLPEFERHQGRWASLVEGQEIEGAMEKRGPDGPRPPRPRAAL